VQTKMVQSKGHSYDHVTMLPIDMACELIEHAIITKTVEVIDGPSRFLQLLHIFRPTLVNRLNALVYGLEREQAPDDAPLPAKRSSRKLKTARPRRGNPVLGFLGRLMWFFSRLEYILMIRMGLPVIVRELIIMLILTLTLVIAPLCEAGSWLVSATRQLRGVKASAAAPSSRQPQRQATSEGDEGQQQGAAGLLGQAEQQDGLADRGDQNLALAGRSQGRRVTFGAEATSEKPTGPVAAMPLLMAEAAEAAKAGDLIEGLAAGDHDEAADVEEPQDGSAGARGRRSRRPWRWGSMPQQPSLRCRSRSVYLAARKRRHTLH